LNSEEVEESKGLRVEKWKKACPACPAGKNDRAGVKFEARKYFTREGDISTGEKLIVKISVKK